eukprot:g6632.t1
MRDSRADGDANAAPGTGTQVSARASRRAHDIGGEGNRDTGTLRAVEEAEDEGEERHEGTAVDALEELRAAAPAWLDGELEPIELEWAFVAHALARCVASPLLAVGGAVSLLWAKEVLGGADDSTGGASVVAAVVPSGSNSTDYLGVLPTGFEQWGAGTARGMADENVGIYALALSAAVWCFETSAAGRAVRVGLAGVGSASEPAGGRARKGCSGACSLCLRRLRATLACFCCGPGLEVWTGLPLRALAYIVVAWFCFFSVPTILGGAALLLSAAAHTLSMRRNEAGIICVERPPVLPRKPAPKPKPKPPSGAPNRPAPPPEPTPARPQLAAPARGAARQPAHAAGDTPRLWRLVGRRRDTGEGEDDEGGEPTRLRAPSWLREWWQRQVCEHRVAALGVHGAHTALVLALFLSHSLCFRCGWWPESAETVAKLESNSTAAQQLERISRQGWARAGKGAGMVLYFDCAMLLLHPVFEFAALHTAAGRRIAIGFAPARAPVGVGEPISDAATRSNAAPFKRAVSAMLLRSVLLFAAVHVLCHAMGYAAQPHATVAVYRHAWRWGTGMLTALALAVGAAVCTDAVRLGAPFLHRAAVDYVPFFAFYTALAAHARYFWMWAALPMAVHLGWRTYRSRHRHRDQHKAPAGTDESLGGEGSPEGISGGADAGGGGLQRRVTFSERLVARSSLVRARSHANRSLAAPKTPRRATSLLPRRSTAYLCTQFGEDQKSVSVLHLVVLGFFWISGGIYGNEELLQAAPVPYIFALCAVAPMVYSLPMAFMCTELSSAMPVDGAGVIFVQEAFGDEWGGGTTRY